MAEQLSTGLTFRQETVGTATVLRVRGSAGINEAEKMQRKLEELAAQKAPLIVLDLSEMDFICSQGLGAIIVGHLRSRHHNGEIRLVNPQPAVRKVLETTRLTKLFRVYASIEKAVR